MKKIRHSKFKNTGILFELLVRQITIEVLNGDKTEHAKKIVKEFFAPTTELNKELRLYELLLKEKYNSEARAEKFIDTVSEAHNRINQKVLRKEKYNLVKRINECFNMDEFLSSPIQNYKVLASIYKLFETKQMQNYDIKDAFNSKITLIENITSKPISDKQRKTTTDKIVEEYKKQDKDLRLLTYKILVETFNKKYSKLDDRQKKLLEQYINNMNNTTKFNEYVKGEIKTLMEQLMELQEKIDDKVTSIKLKETVSVLDKAYKNKKINDNQVSSLMLTYELVKELKGKTK